MRMAEIELLLVIFTALWACALIFASLKQRVGGSCIKYSLQGTWCIATYAVSYILGLMNSAPSNELMVVWSIFLLVLLGTAYSAPASSLDEVERNRRNFFIDLTIPTIGLLLVLILGGHSISHTFWGAVVLLWIFFIAKLKEMKLGLMYASKSYVGPPSTTRIIHEYMENEVINMSNASDEQRQDPKSMKGYRYLVEVRDAVKVKLSEVDKTWEKVTKDMVTLEQIWQCEGGLLSDATEDIKKRYIGENLKDTCLSFSLFWLLLRRFAGYTLSESSEEKFTWRFVRDGLISDNGDQERVFRVIEMEVEFLYDYFYTNYFSMYVAGVRWVIIQVCLIIIYGCWVMVRLFYNYPKHRDSNSSPKVNGVYIDVIVTMIMIIGIILVEFGQIFVIYTSNWFKVVRVCYYVSKRIWERPQFGRFYEGMMQIVFPILSISSWWKPWQRKLGQYSLIDSYNYVPFLLRFECILYGYIDLPFKGQEEDDYIILSDKVKNAVISSLRSNGRKLFNGDACLERNGEIQLLWACNLTTHAEMIMVWHIATSMCENESPQSKEAAYIDNFHVATSLSKYCAYLVVFQPSLLPDSECTSYVVYNKIVHEANELLKQCRSKDEKYQTMMKIGEEKMQEISNIDIEQETITKDDKIIFAKGAQLGWQLIDKIQDEEKRWKVLAEFWAELILYLAPSDNIAAHATFLTRGGEFITHLWVLLTHAGILKR